MSEDALLRDKKEYELSAMLTEETLVSDVEAVIRKHGGEISAPAVVSSIRLAYPLKKHESAFFGVFVFTSSPSNVKAIKDDLTHNSKILRLLLVTPPIKAMPKEQKTPHAPKVTSKEISAETVAKPEIAVSNEALEKKLEEILK